jgi:hypothetical protein
MATPFITFIHSIIRSHGTETVSRKVIEQGIRAYRK